MKYRIPFLFVFILVLGCAEDVSLTKPLLDFVPQNATAVIKINDLSALRNGLSSNAFLADLRKTPTFEKTFQQLRFLNFVQPTSPSILAFIENGNGGFESVYFADFTPNLIQKDSLEGVTLKDLDFKGISMTTYTFGKAVFYQSKLGSRLILSSSPELIETLIEHLKNHTASEALRKLYLISNAAKPATFFIDVNKGNPLLASFLDSTSTHTLSQFSDWISLDLNAGPSRLNLSGISVANDSVWNYVDLLANTKPLTPITPTLAPGTIDALTSYTFDDYRTFARNQNAFLSRNLEASTLFETVEEVGIIEAEKQKAVILGTHGSETLSDYLQQAKTATIDYQGNQIIRLQDSRFITENFKPLVQDFRSNFCTFINDVFVFSETTQFLQSIITNFRNGATYNTAGSFQELSASLSEESSLLFVSNSTRLQQKLQTDLSPGFRKELEGVLKTPYTVAAQITADKNFYHTNLIIEKKTGTTSKKGITTLFRTKLDTIIAAPPQFVMNHLTQGKEVVVQDRNNVLYLISSKGKILWKKPLEAQIQGAIQQVDIFKNGRLQLAFTTNNQFMVLDRNGKEVSRFTTTYEGGGLNPLAVFDYDGRRDYRFVVTQGKKVYMYNSKAAIVEGFKYTTAEDLILNAPKHLRIRGKDYIVFKLQSGALKIMNRVGKVRVKVSERIDFSENGVYLNKDKFTLTDKKGTLHQIDQAGKMTKASLNLSHDHGMYATANTLVLMNDNILTIRGKKIELELGVYTTPRIFYIHDKIYVGVTDLQSQQVYLFDSQARAIPNFPVFGNSIIDLADLDNDGVPELTVIGESDTILTYKLN